MDLTIIVHGGEEKMATINIKDVPEFKMTKYVDLSEDSINNIVEAVAKKIAEPVRHGHIRACNGYTECSLCAYDEIPYDANYCPNCGAKF